MSRIDLRTVDGRTAFEPGETVKLVAEWQCDEPPERAEARLLWYTRGKGDTDLAVVRRQPLERPQAVESREIEFVLPEAPYSFSGSLVSLVWAVRLDVDGAEQSKQLKIVVAPLGREIALDPGDRIEDDNDEDDEDDEDGGSEDELFDGGMQ